MKAVITGILLVFILVVPQPARAADWDKATLTASGTCEPGGVLVVTVTNAGQNMQAATAWQFVVAGAITAAGTLQLGAGASATLTSPPAPGQRIAFTIAQTAGHPGTGVVKVNLACGPNAVTLAQLSARPVGILGWLTAWLSAF
jgi:hypothetical protein